MQSILFYFAVGKNVKPYYDEAGNKVPGIVSFRWNNERHVRCDYCLKYPHIIKQYVTKKLPAIASENGTRFYEKIVKEHLNNVYHKECAKSFRVSTIEQEKTAPMDIAIGKANKKQLDHIGSLLIQIYLDAKRLNLSAHSWPARYVAGEASHAYDSANQSKNLIPDGIDLQYVNTHGHSNLMHAIVQSHRPEFQRKIKECLALSLRIDGSIDFTHIDKIYVMGKLANPDGSFELIFIGIAEQTVRKAEGLMLAVREALKVAIDDPNLILNKVSSLCTDGTNVNTGDVNSLWVLMDEAVKLAGSQLRLLKVWCGAHRAELAWKSASGSVPEIAEMLSTFSKMSTHFHYSAMRIAELKNIASDHGLKVLNIPKIFEIRWSQFTFTLVNSVWVSWEALILYFRKNEKDAECAGFLNYLTKLSNVKLMAFAADVLAAFERFHKKLQSNQLTLIDMKTHVSAVLSAFSDMKTSSLVGGFESVLAAQLTTNMNESNDEYKTFWKTEELQPEQTSRTRRGVRLFSLVRNNLLESLERFLTERFQIDDELFEKIEPFLNFDKNANVEEIHSLLAPDLSLLDLSLQFQDVVNTPAITKDTGLKEIIAKLTKNSASRESYSELIVVLSRIAACTPHSADVERCISNNSALKTKLRSKISVETENRYMHIHDNMPDLCEWNPTAAVKWFMADKSRRQRDATTSEVSKRQYHFKGVFPEAKLSAETGDDVDNENE